VAIRYRRIQGKPVSPENRDLVYYYGKMTFFPHLLRLITAAPVEVRVTYLTPIRSGSFSNRKNMAQSAHHAIASEIGVRLLADRNDFWCRI